LPQLSLHRTPPPLSPFFVRSTHGSRTTPYPPLISASGSLELAHGRTRIPQSVPTASWTLIRGGCDLLGGVAPPLRW
jgi:hypothetical protein